MRLAEEPSGPRDPQRDRRARRSRHRGPIQSPAPGTHSRLPCGTSASVQNSYNSQVYSSAKTVLLVCVSTWTSISTVQLVCGSHAQAAALADGSAAGQQVGEGEFNFMETRMLRLAGDLPVRAVRISYTGARSSPLHCTPRTFGIGGDRLLN